MDYGALDETACGSSGLGSISKSSATRAPKSITSHSFKNRTYSKKWQERETKLFLRALSLFGTDFSMIAILFKGRNRSQVINKFHSEEKENPEAIEKALKNHNYGESRLLRKYKKLFENAKVEAETPIPRGRINSNASLDSTDQTIYDELSSCLTKEFREQRQQQETQELRIKLGEEFLEGDNPSPASCL